MLNILQTLAKQAKTGTMKASTIKRMIDYNNRHPMWRVTAGDQMIAAYDAIYSDYKAAQ
jgi:hypothetical protein